MLLSWGLLYSLSMQNTSALENVQQASRIEQDILIYGVPVMFTHTHITNSETGPTRFFSYPFAAMQKIVNMSRKAKNTGTSSQLCAADGLVLGVGMT